jgi:hypothetical protein
MGTPTFLTSCFWPTFLPSRINGLIAHTLLPECFSPILHNPVSLSIKFCSAAIFYPICLLMREVKNRLRSMQTMQAQCTAGIEKGRYKKERAKGARAYPVNLKLL